MHLLERPGIGSRLPSSPGIGAWCNTRDKEEVPVLGERSNSVES